MKIQDDAASDDSLATVGFDVRAALVRALWAPLGLGALGLVLVALKVAPLSPALLVGVAEIAGELFIAGLVVSFLFESGRKTTAWVIAGLGGCLLVVSAVRAWKQTAAAMPLPGELSNSVPWDYRSTEHAFSLTLPSAGWRRGRGPHLVDFFAGPWGTQELAALSAVEAQMPDEFKAAAEQLKSAVHGDANIIGIPTVIEGKNSDGDPYVFVSYAAKVEAQTVYGAKSRTWLAARGIMVEVMFEGHGAYQSDRAKALERDAFEQAGKSICLSVKSTTPRARRTASKTAEAANSASTSSASSATPDPSASAAPPSVTHAAFAFDWAPPCRVPVIETSKQQGHTTRMGYFVNALPDSHGGLQVRLEDFAFLEVDGQDVTFPEWQPRIKPVVDMAAIVPAFSVSHSGNYQKCEGLNDMFERFFIQQRMSAEEAQNLRRMVAAPGMAATLQANVGSYWNTWVEAWLAWPLQPGASRDLHVMQRVATGGAVPALVRLEYSSLQDGYASLRQTTTVTGNALAQMITPMVREAAKSVGGKELPAQLLKDGRLVTTLSVETQPGTLRPRHTRLETQKELTFPDGSQRSDDEFRDVLWDFQDAKGCTR